MSATLLMLPYLTICPPICLKKTQWGRNVAFLLNMGA